MKGFKKFIAILLVLAIAICVINTETDLFLNIGGYLPAIEENYPQITQKISSLSEQLSDITDRVPSPAEIIAYIRNEELPIDPSDVATNAYIGDSPLLSFYPRENIGIIVDYDKVNIFGITESKSKSNLIVDFEDESGESVEQVSLSTDSNNEFNKTVKIPKTDSGSLKLAVYTGSKPYGQFNSWVYNYIMLVKTPDGGWTMEKSPVFDNNKQLYEKDKSIKDSLKTTPSIQADNAGIISIATQLTEGIDNDYDKVLALHDWICSYMYYDTDSLEDEEAPPYHASDIVKSRRAVCLGFATLMASLCRSINIPCNVVSGYALGIGGDMAWTDESVVTDEQNHAWNEVYAGGRWIIVDTTWDCANKIENGEMIKGENVSHIYFDANLQFFSNNHKIIEYSKRR